MNQAQILNTASGMVQDLGGWYWMPFVKPGTGHIGQMPDIGWLQRHSTATRRVEARTMAPTVLLGANQRSILLEKRFDSVRAVLTTKPTDTRELAGKMGLDASTVRKILYVMHQRRLVVRSGASQNFKYST